MKSDINVTPLIDVLLVLLILFMLVAPMAPRALDASLPERADGPERTPSAGVVIRVESEAFVVDGRPVLDPDELARRLQDALAARRQRTVFVEVGVGVGYARVVDVVSLAKDCGAERIGLSEAVAPQRS